VHAVIESTDQQFQQFWNKLVESDPTQNPLYAPAHGSQSDFAQGQENFKNHSFMVVREQEPVFGCSLTSTMDANGQRRLGFYGREATTLVNRNQLESPSNDFQPEAVRLLMEHFDRLMHDISPDVLDYLDPVSFGLMSPLTQILLEKGALPQLRNSQLIRLCLSESALLGRIDEQYRDQIAWGNKHLAFETISGEGINDYTESLEQLANRYCATEGCADEFLRSCMELIGKRQGFLVQSSLESQDSALFVHNGHTSHLVIADVPGQTDSMPVLQTVIWQAMQFSKQMACAYIDLGGRIEQEVAVDLQKFGGAARTRIKVSYSQ